MSTRDIYSTAFDEDVSTTPSATETCPECDGRVLANTRETTCEDCGLVITAQELDHWPQ